MRYHGGKFKDARRIMPYFPEHCLYAELYGGGAGVLLQKPISPQEIYNDLDGEIVNVFEVLRDKKTSSELYQSLRLTPYSYDEYLRSMDPSENPVEQARRTLVRSWLGVSPSKFSRGRRNGFRSFRKDEPKCGLGQSWIKWKEEIPRFCERLESVVIENRPAIDLMKKCDGPNTLFYLDPPYLHDTRRGTSKKLAYKHEMSMEDHTELLETILQLKSKVVLSCYDSPLYNEVLKGWEKISYSAVSSDNKDPKRKETLYMNFKRQPTLFESEKIVQNATNIF